VTGRGHVLDTPPRRCRLNETLARLALHAVSGRRRGKNPLPVTDANLLAGVQVYHDSLPGSTRDAASRSDGDRHRIPPSPQLFSNRGH